MTAFQLSVEGTFILLVAWFLVSVLIGIVAGKWLGGHDE